MANKRRLRLFYSCLSWPLTELNKITMIKEYFQPKADEPLAHNSGADHLLKPVPTCRDYCQIAAAPFLNFILLFAPTLSRVYNKMILLQFYKTHTKRKRDKFNSPGLSLF